MPSSLESNNEEEDAKALVGWGVRCLKELPTGVTAVAASGDGRTIAAGFEGLACSVLVFRFWGFGFYPFDCIVVYGVWLWVEG